MLDNYEKLKNGLIKQKNLTKKIIYNYDYVNNSYNSYGIKGPQLSGIRYGYLVAKINETPNSILDIGYGNGDFLKVCQQSIKNCFGNDVSDYPAPDGVKFINNIFEDYYDVITFFDVLEHFEEINFIKNLNCKYIYISVPWCHYFSDEWFENWKHRREDEHIWHFNEKSIVNFFNEMGYDLYDISNIEDSIRKTNYDYQNILTCIFKKK
jgi:hypothetical protein